MKDYGTAILAELDKLCVNEDGKPLNSVGSLDLYQAIGRVLLAEIPELDKDENKVIMSFVFSAAPSSQSAARQSLERFRNPQTKKGGKLIQF